MGSCASKKYQIVEPEPQKEKSGSFPGHDSRTPAKDDTYISPTAKMGPARQELIRIPELVACVDSTVASYIEIGSARAAANTVGRSRAPTSMDQEYNQSQAAGPNFRFIQELQTKLDRHVSFLQQDSVEEFEVLAFSEASADEPNDGQIMVRTSLSPEVVAKRSPSKAARSRFVSDYSEIVPWNSPKHSPDDESTATSSRPRLKTSEICKTRKKVLSLGWVLSDSLDEVEQEGETSATKVEQSDPTLASCGRRLCLQDFSRGPNIGSGSFGTVFAARHQTSGQILAVKEVFLERRNGEHKPNLDKVMVELSMCNELTHHRIVRYLGYDIGPGEDDGGSERLFLFMENCSGGSIASHLSDYGKMQLPLIQKYTLQLVEGLEYLHTRQPAVIHRDLKCANLLLTATSDLKITDFGCSKILTEGSKHHSVVGSVLWMAPELMKTKDGVELQTCSDIWAFGCCLLEMATGTTPWSEKHFDNFMHAWRIISTTDDIPAIPSQLRGDAAEFMKACLVRDPVGRASASQLHQHSFLILARMRAQTDCELLT